jgi:hypothetical protein
LAPQVGLDTTLRLTAEGFIAASHCKHKTYTRENRISPEFGGTLGGPRRSQGPCLPRCALGPARCEQETRGTSPEFPRRASPDVDEPVRSRQPGDPGTTNHIDNIDPRVLRGGRFSEKIEIGVPDDQGYMRLIDRYLGPIPVATGPVPQHIVSQLKGISPADLQALVSTAKRMAINRMKNGDHGLPPLFWDDSEEALKRNKVHPLGGRLEAVMSPSTPLSQSPNLASDKSRFRRRAWRSPSVQAP